MLYNCIGYSLECSAKWIQQLSPEHNFSRYSTHILTHTHMHVCKHTHTHTHTHTVPSAPPQNLTRTSPTPTHLRLEWIPPPADQQNGVIREYQITFTELETGRMWNTTTNRLVYEERGLHAYYEYQCSVAAVTVGVGLAQTITVRQPEDGRVTSAV